MSIKTANKTTPEANFLMSKIKSNQSPVKHGSLHGAWLYSNLLDTNLCHFLCNRTMPNQTVTNKDNPRVKLRKPLTKKSLINQINDESLYSSHLTPGNSAMNFA